MYLLNEKIRKFFMPISIIPLILGIIFLFYANNELYASIVYDTAFLIASPLIIIIFLLYVLYPLVKILLKRYGNNIQTIIVLLIIIFSILAIRFSSTAIIFTFSWILYLAVFLNFSSDIKETNFEKYIISHPVEKNCFDFKRIINTSSFNVLLSVTLLTIIFCDSFLYLDLYRLLVTFLSIVLVISSIIYGKNDKSIDY
jgi:hypothetical protein